MNDRIDKSVNDSLNDLVGQQQNSAPQAPAQPAPAQPVQPQAPAQPAPAQPAPAQPAPAQPAPAQPAPAQPVQPQAPAPMSVAPTEQKPMIDPNEIIIGKAYEGDGGKNKLDDDDVEEVRWGDKMIRVSKKAYTIESVDIGKDLFFKKAGAGDFSVSRNGQKQFIETRMTIKYKDSDYVSSLPKISWWPDKYNPKMWTPAVKKVTTQKEADSQFTNTCSKLYFKVLTQFQKETLGIEEFFEFLVGKNVKLVEYVGEFDGKEFRRLDIHQFV